MQFPLLFAVSLAAARQPIVTQLLSGHQAPRLLNKPEGPASVQRPAPPPEEEVRAEAPETEAAAEQPEAEGDGVVEAGESHHHTTCVLVIATVLLVPIFTEFAMHNGRLGQFTFRLIDTFISVFIAVMWFSAFDKLMRFHDFEEHHKVLSAVLHLLFLLVLANALAWTLRGQKVRLAALVTCGSHYVGFAACHAAGHAQLHYFDSIAYTPLYLALLLGSIIILAVVMHQARVALRMNSKQFEDSVGDLENDVMALCLAYVLSHSVKFALSGEIEHFGHAGGEEAEEAHSSMQRLLMCLYGLVMLGASAIFPEAKEGLTGKIMDIAHSSCVMSGAWGFLLALDWEFYETFFPNRTEENEMFASVVFAYCVTGVAFTGLLLMFIFQVPAQSQLGRVLPLALGLAAAWSWEECFDVAVDILADSYSLTPHSDGLLLKMLLAVVTPLCLLPMYLRHVKPRCLEE